MITKSLKAALHLLLSFGIHQGASKEPGPSPRVYWLTPKPSTAPTYEFPTKAPDSIKLLISSSPTSEPPFYTSLPSKAPSSAASTAKPSNKIPLDGNEEPKLFNASKSSKDPKSSKFPPVPPAIESPTFTPSETRVVNPKASGPTSSPLCSSAKWHPDAKFRMCTNSEDYPHDWLTPENQRHFFRATLQQCCEFVFGASGICDFQDVCLVSPPTAPPTDNPSVAMTEQPSQTPSVIDRELVFPTGNPAVTSSQAPSSSPSNVRDTLPQTEIDPLTRSSQPSSNVVCSCKPKKDVLVYGTPAELPSEMPTTSFPTAGPVDALHLKPLSEPPFYTSLPTLLPASSTDINTQTYQLDLKDEESSDFNGFVITTQKETVCSKVLASEVCKLECVVTIKLYHGEVLIREPALVIYETDCLDENTVSTRFLETQVLPVDKMDKTKRDLNN